MIQLAGRAWRGGHLRNCAVMRYTPYMRTIAGRRYWLALLTASILLPSILLLAVAGCSREELSRDELAGARSEYAQRVFTETTSAPTELGYELGRVGGEWVGTINNDPRSFNALIADQDPDSRAVIAGLFEFLVDYDVHKKEWLPNLASFEIENDPEADTTEVRFTLRDDIYWTLPGQSIDDGVAVSADDVVFWYDQIDGDPRLQQSSYSSQFVTLPDGSEGRITIHKINERSFALRYPRIVANPLLSSNMSFGPAHIYEPVLAQSGVEGVRNLFTIDTPVTQIPSLGSHHLIEYTPGVRVVLQRNPHHFKRDEALTTRPYIERIFLNIVPDTNAEYLLFKEGQKDSYTIRPEDLNDLIDTQQSGQHTVYNGGLTLGSAILGFNQNPNALSDVKYSWFSNKLFRQAMSSLLNRRRVANQVYRGLAEPALHFFARPNPYFDEQIRLEYTYDPRRALRLLRRMDIRPDDDTGVMRDAAGNAIEFNLLVGVENNVGIEMANVFADELTAIGINATVKPSDFQKMVDSLLTTYDWDAALFSLGVNYWPSQGSNVWPSSGNLHFWHPLQEEPHTEWEAELDTLYNDGRFTPAPEEARPIYDRLQRLVLEELPVIYIVHQYSFLAVQDRWSNVRYDTLNGLESDFLYLE